MTDTATHTTPLSHPQDWVLVGQIATCHGVQGGLRLKTTDEQPDWIKTAHQLWLIPVSAPLLKQWPQGRYWPVKQLSSLGRGRWLALLEGLTDRTQAESWIHSQVWLPKSDIPTVDEDDTFRTYELVGMSVQTSYPDRPTVCWGQVTAVSQSGALNFLEITLTASGKTVLIPFQTVFFPTVDRQLRLIEVTGLDDLLENP